MKNGCGDFLNSLVGAILCGGCSTTVCFVVQIVTDCSELVAKSELFVHGLIEVGAGASLALLFNKNTT